MLPSHRLDTADLILQGPPYKLALRVLTERFLKRRIQTGEHDSVQVSCCLSNFCAQLQLSCMLVDSTSLAGHGYWQNFEGMQLHNILKLVLLLLKRLHLQANCYARFLCRMHERRWTWHA